MIRNPLLLAAFNRQYLINQSLRFRASNSAHLTRTQITPTSRRIFTFSTWLKRGSDLGSAAVRALLHLGNDNNTFTGLTTDNSGPDRLWLQVYSGGGYQAQLVTNAVFRDPTAWYHVVLAIDTTQATAANRVRLYINGAEITSFALASYPAQNLDLPGFANALNSALMRYLGTTNYLDGYLAETYFVDGQQLTPSSFGQTDPATNSWVPRRYTGTYGANGFYLTFSNATSTTTISQDSSGNGNNWTSSGISVTSGATFDQMTDTPTNNYATLNPLVDATTFGGSPGISAANLNSTGQNAGTIIPTFAMTTGKWYMEVVPTFSGGNHYFGVRRLSTPPTGGPWNETISSNQSAGWYDGAGNFSASGGASFSSGQTLGLTWDADAGTLTIRVNNTLSFTQTVAGWAGVPVVFTYSPSIPTGQSQVWNFGQRAFAHTPPTGFLALNTANLSTPTIRRGDDAFQATLRTGTGATASISSLRFAPDLVWPKSRSNATNHNLFDRVRGAQLGLVSNSTAAEYTDANSLTAFNANGYTFGSDSGSRGVNINTNTYVDWAWREGAAYGFDIVTFTKTTGVQNVAHALNAAPHMLVVKQRGAAGSWTVYHRNQSITPQNNAVFLESTAATAAFPNIWNNTAPTSSQFTVGSDFPSAPSTYVAYLWTEIPGFSCFGGYAGNGSSDGPFVWCGFRPRFILIKNITGATSWMIYDAARNTFNVVDLRLAPDASASEASSGAIDITANGFKLRANDANTNGGATNYIFAAFAETPFKTATAR